MVKRALFILIALAWPVMAEDPDQDKPEFVFARLIYPGGFRRERGLQITQRQTTNSCTGSNGSPEFIIYAMSH
jgi:hypothetical protein